MEEEWVPRPLPDHGMCPQCGERIEIARLSKYVNVKYCGSICAARADAKRRQEKKHKRGKSAREQIRQDKIDLLLDIGLDCLGCKGLMSRERLEDNMRHRFCSDECRKETVRYKKEQAFLERKLRNEYARICQQEMDDRIKGLQAAIDKGVKRKERADAHGARNGR